MGLGALFALGRFAELNLIQGQRIAIRQIKAQIFQAFGKMLGQVCPHINLPAIGMVDAQAARVKVHFAANRARQKGLAPAIFAIPYNGVANGGHMDAQLVGPPSQWLKLYPSRIIPGPINHAIARA